MTTILSVDWDYFFPDAAWYDWGHRETMLLFETLWPMRVCNRNLNTGVRALMEYVPDGSYKTFWNDIWQKSWNVEQVCVAESHSLLPQFVDELGIEGNLHVWNFDAHHDCGYGEKSLPAKQDCGAWVKYLNDKHILKSYNLVYPSWRKKWEEGRIEKSIKSKTQILYAIPDIPEVDHIFLCRSGCWTPPWWDTAWEEFWIALDDRVMLGISMSDTLGQKNRNFTLEESFGLFLAEEEARRTVTEKASSEQNVLLGCS